MATVSSLLKPPKLKPLLFPLKIYQPVQFVSHSLLNLKLRFAAPQRIDKLETFNPLPKLLNSIPETLNSIKNPSITAIIVGLLILGDPHSAIAASDCIHKASTFSTLSSRSSSAPFYSSPSCSNSGPFDSSLLVSGGPDVSFGFGSATNAFPIVMGLIILFLGYLLLYVDYDDLMFFDEEDFDSDFDAFLFGEETETESDTNTRKISLVKLQIVFWGLNKSFQRDLDKISEKANSKCDHSTKGYGYRSALAEIQNLLFLWNPLCQGISVDASVDRKLSLEDFEKRFDKFVMMEKDIFGDLSGILTFLRHKWLSFKGGFIPDNYLVLTVLVGTEGIYELPEINSVLDLDRALLRLRLIPSEKLMMTDFLGYVGVLGPEPDDAKTC